MRTDPPDPRVGVLAERYSAEAVGYAATYSHELVPFMRRLLALVGVSDAHRVLDLGAGTGSSVPHLRAASQAEVILADRALGMLALAPRDTTRVCADAMALPFADASFDVVISAFMVFHLPDPSAGSAEVARILAPDGRFGIATWGMNERLGRAWNVWEEELDRAGAPTPPLHGLPHYQSLGSPELLGPPLERAGSVRVTYETGSWPYRPTHETFMAFMTEHAYRARVGALAPPARDVCLTAIAQRTQDLPAHELGLDADVLLAAASR